MFYYLMGELVLTDGSCAVIDCSGVGYMLTVSMNTQSQLASLADKKNVKLLTHMIVREDGVELFGFYTKEELKLFKMLITVQGVGPKAAISILSCASVNDTVMAIINGNTKAISQAQGVGAKTAARVVLELKDKFGDDMISKDDGSDMFAVPAGHSSLSSARAKDAENALSVLGYSKSEISSVLRSIDIDKYELEDVIKLALAKFMKK